jgi:hypothetical protein
MYFYGWIVFYCIHKPTTFSFLHSFIDKHLGWLHILAVVNSAAKNVVCKCLFNMLTSFPMGIYPQVRFLKKLHGVFHNVCINLQQCLKVFLSYHRHHLFLCPFNSSHYNWWDLIEVLTCISLIIGDDEHFSYTCWSFDIWTSPFE